MAYIDDILTLNPEHVWEFDGNYTDSVGSSNGTNGGFSVTSALCEDVINSVECNATSDRVSIPQTNDIDALATAKALGGWLRMSSIQLPPKSIYREGATGNQYNITMWSGNKIMLDIVSGTNVVQAFSDRVLKPNRIYHVFTRFVGNDVFALYIDGVKQAITEPNTGKPTFANIGSRTAAEFGDPSGTTEVGNATVILNGARNGRYNFWTSFFNASATALTDTQIRETIFEKGVLPSVVVNNQSDLDALANTLRPDEPLNIRIADNGGDLTLQANNITHDPLASIHIQWMGTGVLTYVNNNGSNASIISTPNGGNINLVNPAILNVSPLIAGSEVRVYESGTTNELSGIESSSTNFLALIQSSTVDVVVLSIGFLNIKVKGIDMTQGDVQLPINQRIDRQSLNQ
jgi:hypothetical protein